MKKVMYLLTMAAFVFGLCLSSCSEDEDNGNSGYSNNDIPTWNDDSYDGGNNENYKVKSVCSSCNGTGKLCRSRTIPTYGITSNEVRRCNNCLELLSHGSAHVQIRCSRCQGTGYK
jgi:DnaJ-class molecular chaperone